MRHDSESADAGQSEYIRAILNILEDFVAEKDRFRDTQRAILNVLDDYGSEKGALEQTQRALINILDDFGAEKVRIEGTQTAMLNLLEDFDSEKGKVESTNEELRREIAERELVQKELTAKGWRSSRSNADLEQLRMSLHDLQDRYDGSQLRPTLATLQRQLDPRRIHISIYPVGAWTRTAIAHRSCSVFAAQSAG